MSYKMFKNHPLKLEIIRTIEKDELEFPTKDDIKDGINTYTENDITINKWQDGNHFYAKICDIDVVVNDEVKWNSHDIAMKNAKKFLKELNGKN